ncbi:hypothetical protein BH09SUM1_BH09SUM1_19670 [soil metagenome]
MVKIRLTRVGRTHSAFFRIIVADERRARDGKNIEIIGRYQPTQKDKQVEVQADRALYWLANGAQPTETVRAILRKEGLMKQHHETKTAARLAHKAAKAK